MAIDIKQMRSTPPGYFTVRWGLPEYTDWIDESLSWKETCYIGDWSFLWERRFRGPDVLKLFSDISVNSFAKFDIGQSKHVIHTNKNGKVIHEGILSASIPRNSCCSAADAFGPTTIFVTAGTTPLRRPMICSTFRSPGRMPSISLKKHAARACAT
jgi:hypothetical protein